MDRILVSDHDDQQEIPVDCFHCTKYYSCVKSMRDTCPIIRQRESTRDAAKAKGYLVDWCIFIFVSTLVLVLLCFTPISTKVLVTIILIWVFVALAYGLNLFDRRN